jgi:hypothetical protein
MVDDQTRYNQVQNIIRRSQTLILNVKLLGADTSNAKKLLDNAKKAMDQEDYNSAIEYAKKSMVEVMALKKQVKAEGTSPIAIKSKEESEISVSTQSEEIIGNADKPPQPTPEPVSPDTSISPESSETSIESAQPTHLSKQLDDYKSQFEEGFSYLIEEERANICFNILSQFVEVGFSGLCICRTNPAIIRRKYDLDEKSTVLWLTDRDTAKEATISPSLESMIYVAEEFIEKNEKGMILLDGLEYLISNNSFNPVLRFIRRLIDRISETESLFLIALSPKAINEQELKLLERELHPISLS